MLPNTIIAGVHKAGSTSMFRYLSAHPSVSTSSVKETEFFSNLNRAPTAADLAKYSEFFSHCDPNASVILEASPGYFCLSRTTAMAIHDTLTDVKLLCILRDPVARLISYYWAGRTYDTPVASRLSAISLDDFLLEALNAANSDQQDDRSRGMRWAVKQGIYAGPAQAYAKLFEADKIRYIFFERFIDSPKTTMTQVAQYLGIDPLFYGDFIFSVENKSRVYRFGWAQRLAWQANRRFERFWNKHPWLKRRISNLYNAVNEDRNSPQGRGLANEAVLERVRAFYIAKNAGLAEIVAGCRIGDIPDWVPRNNSDTQ